MNQKFHSKIYTHQKCALVGVAQWVECQPVNQRVASPIPYQEHMPGLWAKSPVGGTPEATTH